jgi:hypothetical protein
MVVESTRFSLLESYSGPDKPLEGGALEIMSALGRNRTCDQEIRRLLLYPLSYEGVCLRSKADTSLHKAARQENEMEGHRALRVLKVRRGLLQSLGYCSPAARTDKAADSASMSTQRHQNQEIITSSFTFRGQIVSAGPG